MPRRDINVSRNNHPPITQSGFFNDLGELGGNHAQFSEVCTALYERELLFIAHSGISNASILKRRIGGLPYHIKSVARYLVTNPTPLSTDNYNGSWYAKQPKSAPRPPQDTNTTAQWFRKNADYGLIVPVLIKTIEGIHLELDAIDKTALVDNLVHLNKHGWFTIEGASQETQQKTRQVIKSGEGSDDASHQSSYESALSHERAYALENNGAFDSKILLKPTKTTMASACSGHAWNFKSRVSPRALSIREMRLSTQINWKNFTLLK
ncbi:hypothetical protein ACOJR9_04530 [Alteromonas sp. A081]|uniref:hypothetical protein n=1 Tax=Alteromonas sp. A081 TaxID=3410269 RepID=UPI003B9855CB